MTTTIQVSAYISEETKAEIEAYVKRHGVKKAHLIEEARQHHLQALREIPEDLVIPARLVLTREAMAAIAERLGDRQKHGDRLGAITQRAAHQIERLKSGDLGLAHGARVP